MGPNPFLGVFLHWLGGLASGSFYVPYKGVKKWSWETYWLVGGFFSWIICPWLLSLLLTHDVVGVLKAQTWTTLWWTYFFGALWGFGGEEELRAAGAAALCASPSEVPAAFRRFPRAAAPGRTPPHA